MKKNLFVVSAYILAIAMIANNLSPLMYLLNNLMKHAQLVQYQIIQMITEKI